MMLVDGIQCEGAMGSLTKWITVIDFTTWCSRVMGVSFFEPVIVAGTALRVFFSIDEQVCL